MQALEHNKWVSLLTLAGTNANDVGADHHQLGLSDIGIVGIVGTLANHLL